MKRVDNPARYGVLTIEKGAVKNIVEKPKQPKSNIINTGIYAFTTQVFSFIEPELDIPNALNDMLAQGYPITAQQLADSVITVPRVDAIFLPVVNTVALQLLAYYTAKQRGCPIDFPRNLAKSVTVE